MLFIKLWLVGIILSVITGIILKKKLNSVSCIIYNHRYMKSNLHVNWAWIFIALSLTLFGGIPNGYLLMLLITSVTSDIVLAILIAIIVIAITISITYFMENALMGWGIISEYFEYYKEVICVAILIVTTLIWAFVFYIL